jgi:lipopolysaccharide biosynthesis regulator YciM
VAAVIPVVFARMDCRAHRHPHPLRERAAAVFARLNSLLNEQPDKAIESFIEVVKKIRRPWISICAGQSVPVDRAIKHSSTVGLV